MKVRKKIGSFNKAAIMQMFEDFLESLDEGVIALLNNFKETDNAEYLEVEIDAEDKILSFTRKDGSHYVYNLSSETIEALAERIDALENASVDTFEIAEDPEQRLQISKDRNNRMVSYRKNNGVLVENAGIETYSLRSEQGDIDSLNTKSLNFSKEGMDKFKQDLIDSGFAPSVLKSGYVSPYLPKYGTINVKSETFYLESHPAVSSIDDVVPIQDYEDNYENNMRRMSRAHYYVKGTLTDNGDGTYSVNNNSVRLMHFASGKVSLNDSDNKYYANTAVTRKNGICYYADTLVNSSEYSAKDTVLAGYTVVAPDDAEITEGTYKMVDVEVTQITGVPCLMAWNVEAFNDRHVNGTDIAWKIDHDCICDVDFGSFFAKENYPIRIKHQGRSTLGFRKRGYRLTPYKAYDYKKKDKIKIGEMIRLSKYNIKAYPYGMLDEEAILYRLFVNIWNTRPITDRYDWDGGANGYYHGATGNLKCFPIKLLVDGEFYGIFYFGEPKDEKNCILDGEDENGMYLQGATDGSNCWGKTLPYNIQRNYSDEQGAYTDEYDNEILSPGSVAAMENWTDFMHGRLYKGSDGNEYGITALTDVDGTYYVTSTLVNGQVVSESVSATVIKVNRKNVTERIDVLGFIDYLICLQVFQMVDNFHNNIILYSNAEKRKLWPFFYDTNDALSRRNYAEDVIQIMRDNNYDLSVWDTIVELFWDDIVNRYAYLRNVVLNKEYIETVYKDVVSDIPDEDYDSETNKWGMERKKDSFTVKIDFLDSRLTWLDENYFIR